MLIIETYYLAIKYWLQGDDWDYALAFANNITQWRKQ